MKTAIPRQAQRQMRFGSRLAVVAMTAAFLLAAANLFAATTATTVELVGGQGAPGYANGDTYHQALFNTPCGLALDPSGTQMLVADRDNNKIRLLELSEGVTYDFAISPSATNLISHPVAVAIDGSLNVFVLNRGDGNNGTVLEFDGEFGDLIATNAAHLTNATAMALDAGGNIFVTINSNTLIRITSPGVSNVVATITQPGAFLQGIVLKHNGLIAACDSGRNGIYLINPTSGIVTTNAGFHGAGDFLNPNNSNPDAVSSAYVEFNQPMGIAEAGDGSLIVTDYGNNRVKVVKFSNGAVTNLYGVASSDWVSPYPGFSSYAHPYDGLAEAVQIPDTMGGVSARLPNGIVVSPNGDIYVTEDYYHIIRHVSGAGFPPPPPPPPGAATGLTATAGYGQVFLTWTAVVGATNYNVKRSTASGGETTIAGTASASYTDTNVLDGTLYYYVVSALNTGGESPNSAEVSAMPLFSPAPTNLIVTATNFGLVSLAWAPSAGATSYNLKRSTSSGGPYGPSTIIASTTGTSYTDLNVLNGTIYYYVVSAANAGGENATNSAEKSVFVPIPPPPPPVIGWFDYEPDIHNNFLTVIHAVSGANYYIAHNDLLIAINPTTNGLSTYYLTTNGPQPVFSAPSSTNGSTPPFYQDGLLFAQPLPVTTIPDLVISAVNVGPGGNSGIVTAEFRFQVANPTIIGNNGAQFTVSDNTSNVVVWYTIDGTDPTNAPPSIGPVLITNSNPAMLSINVTTNVLFQARAFRSGYSPSGIAVQSFSAASYVPNSISFGFASGPGSSHFVASPGQSFFVPVSLSLLPSAPPIYGLQFDVTLTNLVSDPVDPQTIGFGSLVGKPDPDDPGFNLPIPTYEFISDSQPNNDPNAFQYQGDWYQSLEFIDTNNEALLGVGWLEVYGRTNLYNTLSQNLLTYPIVDGTDPSATPNQMVIGAYGFGIPTNASPGDVYQIQIGRPSATTFSGLNVNPYGTPVDIEAPVSTNLLGPGSVNALKNVTIGQIKYLVGSVYPANWYNAGDFGSSNLLNVDVIRVFDFAAYPIASPPALSDLFDALDSCGNIGVLDGATGYLTNSAAYPFSFRYTTTNNTYTYTNGNFIGETTVITSNTAAIYIDITSISAVSTDLAIYYTATNTQSFTTNHTAIYPFPNQYVPNLFNGSDANINQIAFGDGVLDVCDVYVTFRRSLDTNNLVWFQRFWTNGMRAATVTNASAVIAGAFSKSSGGGKIAPAVNTPGSITNTPAVNFTAGDFQATAGQTISIPVTAAVFGPYPLRVAMLNMSVVPLDGSPAVTTPISFSPGAALGSPTSGFTTSDGPGNYAAAWLNSSIAGISSSATIGTLNVTIPANATSASAYAVHFDSASGSPNGLATLPKHTWTGLITLSSRNTSSYNDNIPDSWRLRWFGTINNLLSVSNACPSGDGINNWKKYVAGVDPNTPNDFPSLNPNTPPPSGAAMSIYWPTVSGKQYAILSSANLFPGTWTTNAIVTGNGANMEFDDPSTGTAKFYRVLILQ